MSDKCPINMKAVFFTKENGKITNSDYQELNEVSKRTATRELTALVDTFKTLVKEGTSGSSIIYKIVGPKWGQNHDGGAKVKKRRIKIDNNILKNCRYPAVFSVKLPISSKETLSDGPDKMSNKRKFAY